VSVSSTGEQGNGDSERSTISADGRYVAFRSASTNLVPGDTNGLIDDFVHDRQTGQTVRVSVASDGTQANAVSVGDDDGCCIVPMISADGRSVAITSLASNLVAGDTNNLDDIFVVGSPTPQPPTDLFASSIVGNTLTLRFTPPALGPAPSGYLIEGGVNPGETLAQLPTGPLPLFTLANAPSGAFYVRVRTVTAAGTSGPSNEIRVFINVPAAPSAPTNLLANVDGSTVSLAWQNTAAGGAATALMLDATGSFVGSLPVPLGESASFGGVPPGTYTISLRAVNAVGSSGSSNAVTITVPGACSGAPLPPTNLVIAKTGSTLSLVWDLAASGPAPTGYVIVVTGAFDGAVPLTARTITAAVAPGTYNISVQALNACGTSPATPVQAVTVP